MSKCVLVSWCLATRLIKVVDAGGDGVAVAHPRCRATSARRLCVRGDIDCHMLQIENSSRAIRDNANIFSRVHHMTNLVCAKLEAVMPRKMNLRCLLTDMVAKMVVRAKDIGRGPVDTNRIMRRQV